MSSKHYRESWQGPAGRVEVLIDEPEGPPRAMAIIAHPHPLLGGTAEHKVPAILAKGLREDGWKTVRPNFRGVGATDGGHDEGVGEAGDLVVVAERLRAAHAGLPLVLIGFSFGGYVQADVARRLAETGLPAARLVLLGPGIGKVEGGRIYDLGAVPADTIVVHGEMDTRVPLGNVMRWGEPRGLTVAVVPGADHFFSRRLGVLSGFLRAQLATLAR